MEFAPLNAQFWQQEFNGVSTLWPKRKWPNLKFWKMPEQKIPE